MTEHKEQTDTIKEVNLESSLEQVMWAQKISTPGGKATLLVFTNYVGQGADIEIKLKDYNGKTLDTINAKVVGNHFCVEITVPEKAKDVLFAEVELSKHGLSGLSEALFLIPFVEISNLTWSETEVQRGDVVTLSADVVGVPDGTEAELSIWENDLDGEHRLVTKFPVLVGDKKVEKEWEFEYQGEVRDLRISSDEAGEYLQPEFLFAVNVKGVRAESSLLKFLDILNITFIEASRELPIADLSMKLIKPDGAEQEITLDANGHYEEQDVLPGRYHFVIEKVDIDDEKEEAEDSTGNSVYEHTVVVEIPKKEAPIKGVITSGGAYRVILTREIFEFSL